MFTQQFQKSFQIFIRTITKDILLSSTLLYLTLGTLEIWQEGMVKSVFPLNLVLGILVAAGILETLFMLQEKEKNPRPLTQRETLWILLIAMALGIFVWQNVVKIAGVFAAASAAIITIVISFLFFIATLDMQKNTNRTKHL